MALMRETFPPWRISVAAAPDFIMVRHPASRSNRATSSVAKVSWGDLVSSSPFIMRTAAVPEMPPLINLRNSSVVIRDSMAAFFPVPMPSDSTR